MTLGFRRLLSAGMATLSVSGLSVAADDKSDVYAKDVAFMLDELPKKAGHFFETKGIDWKAVSVEFTKAVKDVHSDEEHLKLCNRLVTRLKDGQCAGSGGHDDRAFRTQAEGIGSAECNDGRAGSGALADADGAPAD